VINKPALGALKLMGLRLIVEIAFALGTGQDVEKFFTEHVHHRKVMYRSDRNKFDKQVNLKTLCN
jgi:hypothetical protein